MQWKFRLLNLVVYISVGLIMTTLYCVLGAINMRSDDDDDEYDDDYDDEDRAAYTTFHIVWALIYAVLFLGCICMVQMVIVFFYRKYYLEYFVYADQRGRMYQTGVPNRPYSV